MRCRPFHAPLLLAALAASAWGCSTLPEPFRIDGTSVGPAADGGTGPSAEGSMPTDLWPAGDLPAGGCSYTPFDWRDGVMYFVMVDRFFDGDSGNNAPSSGAEPALGFQGGDLAGVLKQLQAGYFTGLGVNVLWLSGPFDTPNTAEVDKDGHSHVGYHGYWPAGLTSVEDHLGTLKLLQQLVGEAHKRNIRVVLDYVMNHVHASSAVYTGHKDWFWPLDHNGKKCVCGKACSYDDAVEGKRCWFEEFLPDFNFNNEQARTFSIDNVVWWVKQTCVDGLRLDAVKHIELSWLTGLRQRLNQELTGSAAGTRFYLVGETYSGDRNLLQQYIDPQTMLDGQFDFPLRALLVKTILRRAGSLQELNTFLDGNDSFYPAGTIMGTFLSNHDVPRAIHHAEDVPKFAKGEWESGRPCEYTYPLTEPDADGPYERLAVAYTALLTLPGLPLIYYGGEFGVAGCGDPDNRRFLVWDQAKLHPRQKKLRDHIAKLTGIRQQHGALRRGKRQQLFIGTDVYAYRMTEGSDQLVVVLNRSDQEQSVNLPGGSFTDLLTGTTVTSPAKVPPRTSYVLE